MGSYIVDIFETFVFGVTVIFVIGSLMIGLLATIIKGIRGF